MEYSIHFRTLEKIRKGEPIELYNIDGIGKFRFGKRSNPWTRYEVLTSIMHRNKFGIAPRATDVLSARYSFGPLGRKVIERMVAAGIVLAPSSMEYVFALGDGKLGLEVGMAPKNLVQDLMDSPVGTNGGCLRRYEKFQPEYIRSTTYPRYLLAMLLDEDGPVFKNCFPGVEIRYVTKTYLS